MKKAVFITCFEFFPETRFKHIMERLREKGYKVYVLISDFSHSDKDYVKENDKRLKYIHVVRYKRNLSLLRIVSHIKFAGDCGRALNKIRPNVVYSLIPPNSLAKVCYKYKEKNPDTVWIADLLDLWPESIPADKYKDNMIFTKWKQLRNKYMFHADKIVTFCDYYRKVLAEQFKGVNARTLRQSKDNRISETELLSIYSPRIQEKKIRIAYCGGINYIIDLESIRKIINQLRNDGFFIEAEIIGYGECKDELIDMLKKYGCEVTYYGPVFDEAKKIDILARCDFAINLMKDNVQVGQTTKSVDYISYGLPLISNIKGDTVDFIKKYRIGFNYSNNEKEFTKYVETVDMLELHKNVLACFDKEYSKEKYEETIDWIVKGI